MDLPPAATRSTADAAAAAAPPAPVAAAEPAVAVVSVPKNRPASPRPPEASRHMLVAAQLDRSNFHLLTGAPAANPTTSSFVKQLPSAPIRRAEAVAVHSDGTALPQFNGTLRGTLLSDRFSERTAAAAPPTDAFVPPAD